MATGFNTCQVIEAIQNLPPELREIIYKHHLAMKLKEREVLGWNLVHNELLIQPFCAEMERLVHIIVCVAYMHCCCGKFENFRVRPTDFTLWSFHFTFKTLHFSVSIRSLFFVLFNQFSHCKKRAINRHPKPTLQLIVENFINRHQETLPISKKIEMQTAIFPFQPNMVAKRHHWSDFYTKK